DAVKPRVEVRLLVDATPAPGRVARVGALFRMDPGWHVYWRNPGDSGLATRVRWQVDGAELGPLGWPAPQVSRDEDLAESSYGCTDSVLLASGLVRLAPPGGPRAVRVEVDFLACKDQCIPGRVSLSRDLDRALAGASSPEMARRTRALFERFAERLPRPASALGVAVDVHDVRLAARAGESVSARLTVHPWASRESQADSACASESAAFIPEAPPGLALSDATSGPPAPGARAFTLEVPGKSLADGLAGARVAGVLELRRSDGSARF